MQIGIISEGHTDRAVISTVIQKATDIKSENIKALRPIYKLDQTDIAASKENITISNWTHVKKECETKELIGAYLSILGQDFVAIHIDSAEADLYGVNRPDKNDPNYCSKLRQLIVDKINEWLNSEFADNVLYAIAVEETEAWLLGLHSKANDTSKSVGPKEKLKFELNRQNINSSPTEKNYTVLAKPILKAKPKELSKLLNTNCSLKIFFDEVQAKIPSQKEAPSS